jgi:S1-C subfamily serine protease
LKVAQDLWQYCHVRYGYLGVRLGEIDPERIEELQLPDGTSGIVVLSVEMDLAGDTCGLRAGDVITRMDDYEVKDVPGFAGRLQLREVGGFVNLHVLRGGVPRTLTATLGLRPVPQLPKK